METVQGWTQISIQTISWHCLSTWSCGVRSQCAGRDFWFVQYQNQDWQMKPLMVYYGGSHGVQTMHSMPGSRRLTPWGNRSEGMQHVWLGSPWQIRDTNFRWQNCVVIGVFIRRSGHGQRWCGMPNRFATFAQQRGYQTTGMNCFGTLNTTTIRSSPSPSTWLIACQLDVFDSGIMWIDFKRVFLWRTGAGGCFVNAAHCLPVIFLSMYPFGWFWLVGMFMGRPEGWKSRVPTSKNTSQTSMQTDTDQSFPVSRKASSKKNKPRQFKQMWALGNVL